MFVRLSDCSQPLLDTDALLVVSFCAAWCGTCRDFQPLLERIACRQEDVTIVWADIEDDAALVGDIDVEDFPTLALFRRGRAVFFGTTLPHEAVVMQLMRVALDAPSALSVVPDEVSRLGETLMG